MLRSLSKIVDNVVGFDITVITVIIIVVVIVITIIVVIIIFIIVIKIVMLQATSPGLQDSPGALSGIFGASHPGEEWRNWV